MENWGIQRNLTIYFNCNSTPANCKWLGCSIFNMTAWTLFNKISKHFFSEASSLPSITSSLISCQLRRIFQAVRRWFWHETLIQGSDCFKTRRVYSTSQICEFIWSLNFSNAHFRNDILPKASGEKCVGPKGSEIRIIFLNFTHVDKRFHKELILPSFSVLLR